MSSDICLMSDNKCRMSSDICPMSDNICQMFDRFCPISIRFGRVLPHYAPITLEIVLSDKSLARDAPVPVLRRSHLQIASISVAPVQTMLFRLGLDHEL